MYYSKSAPQIGLYSTNVQSYCQSITACVTRPSILFSQLHARWQSPFFIESTTNLFLGMLLWDFLHSFRETEPASLDSSASMATTLTSTKCSTAAETQVDREFSMDIILTPPTCSRHETWSSTGRETSKRPYQHLSLCGSQYDFPDFPSKSLCLFAVVIHLFFLRVIQSSKQTPSEWFRWHSPFK